MTRELQAAYEEYASYHRSKENQLTHVLGIPLIVVGLLGLLSLISLPGEWVPNLGALLLWLGIGWYVKLDWKRSLKIGPVMIIAYSIGLALSWELNASLFILGWALQLLGHYKFEKKAPAFSKNLEHLLIGPLWILEKIWKSEKQN